jgi:general stress protein 26
MTAIEIDIDGYLWFFSSLQSELVADVSMQPSANVSFAEPKESFYLSLAGHAQFVKDRAQYEEIWKPVVRPWFPRGVDDPDLVLMRFQITDAMYWSSEMNRMVKLMKLVTAAATGERPAVGIHGRIHFH